LRADIPFILRASLRKKEPYTIRLSGTHGVSTFLTQPIVSKARKYPERKVGRPHKGLAEYVPTETVEVPNREVQRLLSGLLNAFEKSSTRHYVVQRAKTSIVTTKNAEGELGISLGLGIFKFFDATGNVKGEWTEGIEIEIERRGTKK